MKKPELQVTPGQALTHMLANMSFEVLTVSGKAIATFLNDITSKMIFFFNLIHHFKISSTINTRNVNFQ